MKSLKAQGHLFADSVAQLERLNANGFAKFSEKLNPIGLSPLKPTGIDIFQINMGKMCNQTCKHCHVDAGPDRKEIMTQETLQLCLDILAKYPIPIVDLTGGAPEMNPHFRWFVEEASKMGRHIMVRCNLTIILANPKYHDLPAFFAKHKVEVVSSLPHYTAGRTDRQRGDGVFEKSIQALQMLNEVGYGIEGTDLKLNLVYNPTGAILPGPQGELQADYKRELRTKFGISFNQLYVITNMPISRFLDYLISSENYEGYMQKLIDAFNPGAALGVMCRNTLSIGWDGFIYDCDFNQMLDIKVAGESQHLRDFDFEALAERVIVVDQHCYGCTAGLGSSCGGQVV
jgi:radical SAM/Cys-rich protein